MVVHAIIAKSEDKRFILLLAGYKMCLFQRSGVSTSIIVLLVVSCTGAKVNATSISAGIQHPTHFFCIPYRGKFSCGANVRIFRGYIEK